MQAKWILAFAIAFVFKIVGYLIIFSETCTHSADAKVKSFHCNDESYCDIELEFHEDNDPHQPKHTSIIHEKMADDIERLQTIPVRFNPYDPKQVTTNQSFSNVGYILIVVGIICFLSSIILYKTSKR